MTLTPDDLPPADGGAAQYFCSCTGELFKIILAGGELVGECSSCGSTASRWAIAGAAPQAITFYETPPAPGASGHQVIGPGRDTMGTGPGGGWPPDAEIVVTGGRGGPQVAAGWGSGPRNERPMSEEEIAAAMAKPPPLPAFSPEIANTYLHGGPYDGQVTWVGDGVTEFLVSGVQGKYVPHPDGIAFGTDGGRDRAVFVFVPLPQV